MKSLRTLVAVVLPSMIAGGLLVRAPLGHASVGEERIGLFGAGSGVVIAQVTPPKHTPRTPPTPPTAPTPPTPPVPAINGLPPGVSVTIDGGHVKVTGIDKFVREQIKAARAQVKAAKMPKAAQDKVLARLDKVSAIVDKHLAKVGAGIDVDNIDDEMEGMGDEIEEALDGIEDDFDGVDMQDLAKSLGALDGLQGNFHFTFDHDNDDDDDRDNDHDDDDDDRQDIPDQPDLDGDDADLRDSITDLKDLALSPQQRDQIAKLRADSDKNVATAKKQLDSLSAQLETALANPNVKDADVSKLVDQISAQEAAVRKARIIAWVNARRILDDAQRKKVEAATKKAKTK